MNENKEGVMLFQQQISEDLFKQKYCLHEQDVGWADVAHGVAQEIAMAEKRKNRKKWEDIFYKEISSGRFIPGGRILANARVDSPMKNYSNCFTIGIEDDMEDIYNALKEDALISKVGGGVGFNISKLRPEGSALSIGGIASGPISFLEIFNQSAKTIMTGGFRRSAHIAVLNVDHPDIEKFITYKQGDKSNRLTQFNISVGVTEDFMNAVTLDKTWDLVFNGKVYKTVSAKYLFDLITENSYTHNEPGIYFIDEANRYNNGKHAFNMNQINPCGEITMGPYSLCDLGAINLTRFVKNPFVLDSMFDWAGFRRAVSIGVRFLDNVLDRTKYPLQKIKDMSMQWRRIGLGITGLGDMFAMMGMKYGDPRSIALSLELSGVLKTCSYTASANLAKEKGKLPAWDKQILDTPFVSNLPKDCFAIVKKYGLRNIGLNTIAPTGTTALTIGNNCSSGIEPIFALEYTRNIRTDGDDVRIEKVEDYAWWNFNILNDKKLVDPEWTKYFVTTKDINGKNAISIQAAWQRNIDHSISKTHNLAPGTTLEEYQELLRSAHTRGLKGFTSFNPEGSMKGILEYNDKLQVPHGNNAEKRLKEMPCDIYFATVKKEKFLVLVGMNKDDSPYEIFVTTMQGRSFNIDKNVKGAIDKVRKGHYNLIINDNIVIEDISREFDSTLGTLSRFISMSIRHNVPLQFIVEQLHKGNGFASFEKVVGRILKKYIPTQEKVMSSDKCPVCGSDLMYVEGCKKCASLCGWEACS